MNESVGSNRYFIILTTVKSYFKSTDELSAHVQSIHEIDAKVTDVDQQVARQER